MMMRVVLMIFAVAMGVSGCAAMAVRAVAQTSKPDLSEMLSKADANHDGTITKAEFTDARAKLFTRLDRNSDGFVTKDDTPRLSLRRNGDRIAQAITMLDKDGDGRVSRDEFVNGPSLLFDRVDTNHDGVIDAAELAAFKAARSR
jgi:hypothetical protein